MSNNTYYYLMFGSNLEDIDRMRHIFLEEFHIDLDEEDEDDEPFYFGGDVSTGRITIRHNVDGDYIVAPDYAEFTSIIFIKRHPPEMPLDKAIMTHPEIRAEKLWVRESVLSDKLDGTGTKKRYLYKRPPAIKK